MQSRQQRSHGLVAIQHTHPRTRQAVVHTNTGTAGDGNSDLGGTTGLEYASGPDVLELCTNDDKQHNAHGAWG